MSKLPSLADRLSLIVLTDEAQAGHGRLLDVVRAALRGGAPAVQVRSKHATGRHMVELTRMLLVETRAAGALLFVNDRIDVALAAGADGAHLGDDDLPLAAARRIVPPSFILGRSVETPEQAQVAEREGANYLGAGPIFSTESKPDAGEPIGLANLRHIADAVRIPVVAIGGINAGNAGAVRRAGAIGIALIRAVMQAENPEEEVRRLLQELKSGAAG